MLYPNDWFRQKIPLYYSSIYFIRLSGLLLAIWGIMGLFSYSYATSSPIDSLRQRLATADITELERAKTQLNLASAYQAISHDSTLHYSKMAYEKANELGEKSLAHTAAVELIISYIELSKFDEAAALLDLHLAKDGLSNNVKSRLYWLKGTYYLKVGEMDKVSATLDTAEQVLREMEVQDDKLSMKIAMTRGNYHLYTSQLLEAVENYLYAEKIANEINDTTTLINLLNNIAIIHYQTKKYEKSITYFKKSIELNKQLNNYENSIVLLMNLSNVYKDEEVDKIDLSIKTLNESIALAKKTNNVQYQGLLFNSLASIYYNEYEDYNKGKEYLDTALAITQKQGQKRSILSVYSNYFDMYYFKVKDYDKAIKYGKKMLALAEETNDQEAMKVGLIVLSEAYEKVGNAPQALSTYKRYMKVDSTLTAAATEERLQNLLVEHETALKQQKINYQELELEKNKIAITKANQLKAILISILVFLLIIVLLLYAFFRQKSSTAQKISQLNDSLTEKNNTLESQNKKIEGQKNEMSQMIQQLNHKQATIDQQNQMLKESNQSLENFALVAAHDIKAPIRTINSFSNLIYRRYKNVVEEDDVKWFEFISSSTKKLMRMVEDLYQFSKITQDVPEPSRINLNEEVQFIFLKLKSSVSNKEVTLDILKEIPIIHTYDSLLRQLFLNLINNSIKFSKVDAPNHITIDYDLIDDQYVELRVSDTGIGIPEDIQPDVFKMFSKHYDKSADKKSNGSGIGLATCNKIVSFLGGTIRVESTFGEGTTMIFTLKITDISDDVYYIHNDTAIPLI